MRLLIFALCLVHSIAHGTNLSIEEIRVKTAPAFAVIGVEPSSVEKPTSPKAFGIALAGSMSSGNSGAGIGNVAIESSPYWWFNGGTLTFDEYYGSKKPLVNAARTLTLSLATRSSRIAPVDEDTEGSSLGIGFRMRFFMGSLSADAKAKQAKLVGTLQQAAANADEDWLEDLPVGGSELGRTSLGTAIETIRTEVQELRTALQNPEGFQLEMAGGAGFESDKKDLSNAKSRRLGIWLNASYRPKAGNRSAASSFDFIATARYLRTELADDQEFDNFDVGVRILWARPAQPLSASVEYVRRFRSASLDDTKRFAVVIEYAISDTTAVFLSNGKDFDNNGDGTRESFSFVGLNFAFGKPGVVNLTQK